MWFFYSRKLLAKSFPVDPEDLGRPGLVVPDAHQNVLNIVGLDLGESAAEVSFTESGEASVRGSGHLWDPRLS